MKLKSYFSGTVEAAMELARKELGEDALLVNARPATPETRYLGAYEVVFGVLPPETAPVAPPLGEDPIRTELAELRRQIDRLTMSPAVPQVPAPLPVFHPLEAVDFRVDANIGRVVALVGPPGVGKTPTLIKLAARYGLARRKSAQILTTDVFRIAAADQLRTLGAILGIPCEVADTPSVLAQRLEEQRSRNLVLIDTPGFSFREMGDASELAEAFADQVETHLVLAASMKASDMSRVADSYAIFRPSKLIFTRVDETASYGALIKEASRLDLPVSFLCTGQRIPDDLEEATISRLTALTEEDRPLRMGAAA